MTNEQDAEFPLDPHRDYAAARHVLVVDDDKRICELVARYLGENGFVVLCAHDTDEARALMDVFAFDALVVDVMMPGQTGVEFTRELRAHSDIPVLFLTALGQVEDRIDGFEAGGDDYLPKPFEPKELVFRLHAILRRVPVVEEKGALYQIGRWQFDPDYEELRALNNGDDVVALTSVERNLLKALLQKPGEVMSRDELADALGVSSGERTIDVQVTRLRRKIEEDSKMPRCLQTVRGKGYLLRVQEVV